MYQRFTNATLVLMFIIIAISIMTQMQRNETAKTYFETTNELIDINKNTNTYQLINGPIYFEDNISKSQIEREFQHLCIGNCSDRLRIQKSGGDSVELDDYQNLYSNYIDITKEQNNFSVATTRFTELFFNNTTLLSKKASKEFPELEYLTQYILADCALKSNAPALNNFGVKKMGELILNSKSDVLLKELAWSTLKESPLLKNDKLLLSKLAVVVKN